jgi:CheY-like chemotaxis protein
MHRILIVEDNPVDQRLFEQALGDPTREIEICSDGREALAAFERCAADVVISDIMMPKRDGLQLLTDLKADPGTHDLPVILLSAKAQRAEVQQGLDLGADDYITKPFDPLELIDRLNAVVTRPRR